MSEHRAILRIAVPSILSNITVPLLGWVDTAIAGHLGTSDYLAAIAIGSALFSVTYTLFNFLRMGTGGLTAQAYGSQRHDETALLLLRGLLIALGIGALLIALQTPLLRFGLSFMTTSAPVAAQAVAYYRVLIWGAPATLSLYVLNGWLLGRQDARTPLLIAVVQNLLNIGASLLLVHGFGLRLIGVAGGTLLAQWVGAALALFFALRTLRRHGSPPRLSAAFRNAGAWRSFFTVNVFIFLRTLCLVAVMFSFTAFGSRRGPTLLSANAVLLQLFTLVSYVMDGFAYAGEAVGGHLVGAGSAARFRRLVRSLFAWGLGLSLLFSAVFALGGSALIALFTDAVAVRQAAESYLLYDVLLPPVAMSGFLLDGLFVGTTATSGMLLGVAVAAAGFFALHGLLAPTLGNHGLWIAFLAYLALRGLVQGAQLPAIVRRSFAPSAAQTAH